MAKLIALYKKPGDQEQFDTHYFGTHTPLVKKIPGLRKAEVTKVIGAPSGDSEFYLMCEMFFDNRDSLDEAMRSKEMRNCGKDLMSFAGELVTMMIGEEANA